MKQLSRREEQIMNIVWRLKKAFIRDIVNEMTEPKPHYNTVATIVKILVKKGLLNTEILGIQNRYSPTNEFASYREKYLAKIKSVYFGNSLPKMMTYFAKQENISKKELSELIRIIKSNKS